MGTGHIAGRGSGEFRLGAGHWWRPRKTSAPCRLCFHVIIVTVICNLHDNMPSFDVIVFLGILAVGLVILLQVCDLYKSRRQAAFTGRERTPELTCVSCQRITHRRPNLRSYTLPSGMWAPRFGRVSRKPPGAPFAQMLPTHLGRKSRDNVDICFGAKGDYSQGICSCHEVNSTITKKEIKLFFVWISMN